MNEPIKINYENAEKPTVSGRDLHEALGIETPYKKWFDRMCEYGFMENKDFWTFLSESTGGRPSTDHQLTIAMAKELCMIQRTEIGRKFRLYFISVEEAWNSPEMVMQRALTIANERVKALQLSVSELTVENQIMKPKADYFDELVDRNLLTGIRETAKELHLGQKVFVNFLLDNKYLYRTKKGKLMPYMQYVEAGLFELKEFFNESSGYKDTQTMITPKGKETFRLLCI
ncbi:MAG TPA: antA/AntB antirepressor family protein [Ruminococcus sp.]|nr:antA/AntB antirepressor family protein [Ruminococcus sp.]